MAFRLLGGPTHGELTLQVDGWLEYRPDADFNGADAFTYSALYPDRGWSAPGSVVITVTPVFDATKVRATSTAGLVAYRGPVTFAGTLVSDEIPVDGELIELERAAEPVGAVALDGLQDGDGTERPLLDSRAPAGQAVLPGALRWLWGLPIRNTVRGDLRISAGARHRPDRAGAGGTRSTLSRVRWVDARSRFGGRADPHLPVAAESGRQLALLRIRACGHVQDKGLEQRVPRTGLTPVPGHVALACLCP